MNQSVATVPAPFYDVTEHFAKRFDQVGRQLAFRGRTRAEAVAWQKKLRAQLARLFALDTFAKTKPRPKRLGREDMGSHWREDWTIHTEPDVIAPFYALVPKTCSAASRRTLGWRRN